LRLGGEEKIVITGIGGKVPNNGDFTGMSRSQNIRFYIRGVTVSWCHTWCHRNNVTRGHCQKHCFTDVWNGFWLQRCFRYHWNVSKPKTLVFAWLECVLVKHVGLDMVECLIYIVKKVGVSWNVLWRK
jgi:hypothetical protein